MHSDAFDDLKFFKLGRWIDDPRKLLQSPATSVLRGLSASPAAVWAYRRLAPVWIGHRLKSCEHYLYHSPNFILPKFPGKSITTFHDLGVIRHPEFHRPTQVALLEHEIAEATSSAHRIIAISQFVKREISQTLGYDESKIGVVPNGVADVYHPRSLEELRVPLQHYELTPGRYFLSVATIEPRKNIDLVLDSYERLPQSIRSMYPLVICGTPGWRCEHTLARIQSAHQRGRLIYLGYVPEEGLPVLYAGATAVVSVPIYEGFGLPVLEAMASGVPVIASNIPPHLELAEDVASWVESNDSDALTQQMLTVVEPDEARLRKLYLGIERAKGYSWQRTVEKTVVQYQLTINQKSKTGHDESSQHLHT